MRPTRRRRPTRNIRPPLVSDKPTACAARDILGAVLLFAKESRAGAVKTRLCPPLDPAQALAVHDLMVAATLERLALLPARAHWLALASAAGGAPWRPQPPWTVVAQGEGDLGDRLRRVSVAAHDSFGGPLLIAGGDSPDLPLPLIHQAVESAQRGVPAVVPAADGGYCLLAIDRPRPALFHEITWGSPHVLAQTLAAARAAGIALHVLPGWEDVDTHRDLRRLAARIAAAGEPALRELHRALVSLKLSP